MFFFLCSMTEHEEKRGKRNVCVCLVFFFTDSLLFFLLFYEEIMMKQLKLIIIQIKKYIQTTDAQVHWFLMSCSNVFISFFSVFFQLDVIIVTFFSSSLQLWFLNATSWCFTILFSFVARIYYSNKREFKV